MKKILTILFVLTSFFASAQKLDSIRGAGYFWERMMAVKSLGIPTFCGIPKTNYTDSTKKAQIGYDSCAGKFYTYNPATETWSEPGGAGSGIDSVTITSTGCVKTFSTWSGGTESVIGTVTQPNGLAPGTGIATKTTGTTFTVTAATYTINCITYQSRDTTITLTAAGDTGRIDVIKVNTSGVTTQGTGTEGDALALPSLSATELALTYVLVTDTGVTVSLPTDTALWVSVGNDIRNANAGAVHVTTNLQIGNYTRGNWLTSGAHTNTYFVAQDGFYLTNPANSSLTKTGISQGFGNAANFWAGGNIIGSWRLVGNTTGNQFNISSGYNPASGGGEAATYSSTTTLSPTGANSINYTVFDAQPTYTQGIFGTGALRGFRYKPILTSLNTSRNIAFENYSGDIIHRNLAGSGTRMVVANDSGLLSTQAIPGGGGGSQDLQDVTTIDSTSTHEIIVQGARLAAKGLSTMYGSDAGTDDNSSSSVGIGYGALSFASGTQNIGIGVNAAQGVIGNAIVGIGRDAGINNVGNRNIFIGDNAGDNSAGSSLVGIGVDALSNNGAISTAEHVTAIGDSAGHFNQFSNVSILGTFANADSTNQVVLSDGVHQVRLDHGNLTGDIKARWQDRDGTIAYLDDITGSTSDTIFVDAPLEAYTSGDSNKIRINPDTLAAWRSSGTYTPTATIVANVASTTPAKCFWIRVGNIVTVTGSISIGTDNIDVGEVLLTTPIPYIFQDPKDAAGVPISESLGAINQPYILANVDENTIRLIFDTVSADDSGNISFTFSYEIL